MTKLTTERLEELANATTPSVKYVGREIIAMARQLLAYEQAAKEVACWGVTGQRGQIYPLPPQTARMDSFPLYRAPVLPKQPEPESIICWSCKKTITLTQRAEADGFCPLCDAEIELEPAQPVIPEQTEREKIRREHAKWSDATFGNVGPVGPLKHLSKEALEAAADPSDPLEWADMQFLLWDAQRRMGISDDFITKAMIEKLEINKKRQWPEPKDGEPRLHIKKQLAQPVSEPYKLPVGYFSYGSECGFDWHNTEKEAIEAAEAVIDNYRGDACDGWPDETDSVCWGVVLQQATKVDERPRTNDDKCDPAIDMVCEYALLPELVGNSPVIPEGWKLVPIEPTAEMYEAGDKQITTKQVWDSMLAAAPTAQERE